MDHNHNWILQTLDCNVSFHVDNVYQVYEDNEDILFTKGADGTEDVNFAVYQCSYCGSTKIEKNSIVQFYPIGTQEFSYQTPNCGDNYNIPIRLN